MKLKQFLGEVVINENGEVLINSLGRMFKTDPAALKPSEYLEILKYLD